MWQQIPLCFWGPFSSQNLIGFAATAATAANTQVGDWGGGNRDRGLRHPPRGWPGPRSGHPPLAGSDANRIPASRSRDADRNVAQPHCPGHVRHEIRCSGTDRSNGQTEPSGRCNGIKKGPGDRRSVSPVSPNDLRARPSSFQTTSMPPRRMSSSVARAEAERTPSWLAADGTSTMLQACVSA